MRLPLFNSDWTPKTETLEASDYFNPSINRAWEAANTYHSDADAIGYMSLKHVVAISKALVPFFDVQETFNIVRNRFSGDFYESFYEPIAKLVYDSFPEDLQYLRFYTGFRSLGSVGNGRWKVRAFTVFPASISYNESNRDTYSIEFFVNFVNTSDTVVITDAQAAEIREKVLNHLTQAHEGFNSRMGARLYAGDTLIPKVVKTIYNYNTNGSMFYPITRSPTLGGDWTTPRNIAYVMESGATVRLEIPAALDLIHFKEVPRPSDRRTLSSVLNYTANVLDYLPFTIKGPKEPSATLYGVELETSSAYTPTDIIAAQTDLFFIMKADSSIRGCFRNAYEMVTVPASMRAHKRLWAEFFEKVDYTKFDTSKDTGNGMHVHVDRKTFKSNHHLNRFTWFFIDPTNTDFLFTMSERPSKHDMQTWAPTPRIPSGKSYVSCVRGAKSINGSLRGAVHYKGDKTVEIRIFKGLVSYATIVKNIEFVDSVVEYTRFVSSQQLSLSDYLSWLESSPKNKYTMLKQFLAEAKLDNVRIGAKLDRYLWGIKREDHIAEKLNKAPFKITSAMITLLNRRIRKKTYTLKDGVVSCVIRNSGLLSKLDKIAQQRQTRGASSFSVSSI